MSDFGILKRNALMEWINRQEGSPKADVTVSFSMSYPQVTFYPTLVSSISREPNIVELFVMSSFNQHLRDCTKCRRSPCSMLGRIAKSIEDRLEIRKDGFIYSRLSSYWVSERVEIPKRFRCVYAYLGCGHDNYSIESCR